MNPSTEPSPPEILLRQVAPEDLPIFFEYQLDPQASRMAAFTAENPSDRQAFDRHWKRLLGDPAIIVRTVVFRGQVAGHMVSFRQGNRRLVGYWTGRDFWGLGITTAALRQFLDLLEERPLFALAAHDNAASIRILEKCGFVPVGQERGFASARQELVEEILFRLDS
jgi:RimJ/RimL family protein N-acetyltransferase